MNISSLAVRKGVTFTMIYLIIVGFGIFALTQLKTDLLPDIEFPSVIIVTTYPGVAPEDMENLVTRPIEEMIVAVEDVQRVSSQSSMGTSLIVVEFSWGSNIEKAELDIIKRIDMVKGFLPDDANDPLTFALDPSLFPVLVLGLTSQKTSLIDLREISKDQIEPRIERLPGVAIANTFGGLNRQIQVHFDPYALSAKGLSVSEIIQAIRMENIRQPGGFLTQAEVEYSVRTLSTYQSVDQIANTVVGYREGTPIYLKDVADVRDWFQEARGLTRTNRSPSVVLVVQKQSDANTVETVENILRELPAIQRSVGHNIEFITIFNQADFINRSINTLANTAIAAFFLVGLVLLFFTHNLRSSIIVAFSIPAALIATFFVMYVADLTLNIISLAGLALAIGLIVDNSIVVLENIYRLREAGGERFVSAIDGSIQVARAITASALTTLAVFVPVLFVPGIAGVLFNDMVVTISFSIAVALIIALTLIPLLASRFLKMKTRDADKPSTFLDKLSERITIFIERLKITYERSLRWALDHKKFVLISLLILFIGSLGILAIIGTEFFPSVDAGSLSIQVRMAEGAALEVTDETIRKIENYMVNNIPELKLVNVNMGTAGGPGAILQGAGSHIANIRIELVRRHERDRTQFEVEDQLRAFFDGIPGIVEYEFEEGGFAGMGADVEIKIFGHNFEELREMGDRVLTRVKQIPGAVDVTSTMEAGVPELLVDIDRDRTSLYGLRSLMVSDVVYSSIQGTVASFFSDEGNEYDILVRLPSEYRTSIEILENLLIRTPAGVRIPLKAVAEIRRDIAPVTIHREDQQRMAIISLSVSGRDLGSLIRDINSALGEMDFPVDMRYEIGGVAEDMQESFFFLGIAFAVAILLVYMVMAANFESFLHPFLIIFAVPLAMIGVLWALLISWTTLSVTALIGLVILVGIVVNNGIVIVDFINRLREDKGLPLIEAVVEAGKIRMRPVLMTGFTTIFALLPLALGFGEGSEVWSPMAIAVIGGMLFATLVTLILIPVLYVGLDRFSKKFTEYG